PTSKCIVPCRLQQMCSIAKRPRAAPAAHDMPSGVNRDFLEMALAQAGRHVARGEVILARQRATIAASERIGRNVGRSKEFLSLFEESQRLHVADRDRLRRDLENALRT